MIPKRIFQCKVNTFVHRIDPDWRETSLNYRVTDKKHWAFSVVLMRQVHCKTILDKCELCKWWTDYMFICSLIFRPGTCKVDLLRKSTHWNGFRRSQLHLSSQLWAMLNCFQISVNPWMTRNCAIICKLCAKDVLFLLVGIISRIAMNGGVGGPGHSCYLVSVLSLS